MPDLDSVALNSESAEHHVTVKLTFPAENVKDHVFHVSRDAVLSQWCATLGCQWPDYDWSQAKFIVSHAHPQSGSKKLLKRLEDSALPMEKLAGASLRVMVSKHTAVDALEAARKTAVTMQSSKAKGQPRPQRPRSRVPMAEDSRYTFHRIEVLPLPRPERSRKFLERLRDDPGIRAAMKKHKFSVGLLMEMDPGSNTAVSQESTIRLLGLNRNHGEVIELRLRTDAYDGYRDYKTIRNTLCHELTHNVHASHDRKFWDLCHQIEREVGAADWKSGGRSVGDEEFAPSQEDDAPDHEGWTGGDYVLGGTLPRTEGLTAREIRAQAAERRLRNLDASRRAEGSGDEGSKSDAA